MPTDNQGLMNLRPFTQWMFAFGSDQIPYHSVSVNIREIRGKIRPMKIEGLRGSPRLTGDGSPYLRGPRMHYHRLRCHLFAYIVLPSPFMSYNRLCCHSFSPFCPPVTYNDLCCHLFDYF
jgi:hypothetical protein